MLLDIWISQSSSSEQCEYHFEQHNEQWHPIQTSVFSDWAKFTKPSHLTIRLIKKYLNLSLWAIVCGARCHKMQIDAVCAFGYRVVDEEALAQLFPRGRKLLVAGAEVVLHYPATDSLTPLNGDGHPLHTYSPLPPTCLSWSHGLELKR